MVTLATGFFDGVHLGHQAILEGADAALTFLEHPLTVLAPEKAPRLLMSFEERIRAIARPVTVLNFTSELAGTSAADFAERYLKGFKVRCGQNWRFGKGGEGCPEWLKAHGYEVEVVKEVEYKGEAISSSRIRAALERGEMEEVAAMLARPYSVGGAVAAGKGEGRNIGYPTLNLEPAREINLREGVYSAIVNYGKAPTFGERAWKRPVLEAHLVKFLREERKFSSPEELKAQIAADLERCGAVQSPKTI